ncbi:AMP-binding protein, partial [Streptomyces sp. NRAIS3]
MGTGAAKFDLGLEFSERASGGMDGLVEYSSELFDHTTVERLTDRLLRLLGAVVTAPDTPIGDLDILDDEERLHVLTTWNDSARALEPATVPELFARRVAADPQAPALLSAEGPVSAVELDARASRLAHHLVACGVGAESLVALALPRSSEELVVAAVAVWKAGGAYVPVDPAYPAERIAYMLDDARPALVLATTGTADRLPEGTEPVLLDALELSGLPDTAPDTGVLPENPAYVIYTSGSTGRPKGV